MISYGEQLFCSTAREVGYNDTTSAAEPETFLTRGVCPKRKCWSGSVGTVRNAAYCFHPVRSALRRYISTKNSAPTRQVSRIRLWLPISQSISLASQPYFSRPRTGKIRLACEAT